MNCIPQSTIVTQKIYITAQKKIKQARCLYDIFQRKIENKLRRINQSLLLCSFIQLNCTLNYTMQNTV